MIPELTEHEREQMGRYGVPFRSTEEQRAHAVMDVSVYNVLSIGRRDRTMVEILAVLETSWDSRGPAAHPVNAATLRASIDRLVAAELVTANGDVVGLVVRDPNGHGFPVVVDYMNGRVVRG